MLSLPVWLKTPSSKTRMPRVFAAAHRRAEVFLSRRAAGRFSRIVRRVVTVVGVGFKNGVQIKAGHAAETLNNRQLFLDALQVAAEKVRVVSHCPVRSASSPAGRASFRGQRSVIGHVVLRLAGGRETGPGRFDTKRRPQASPAFEMHRHTRSAATGCRRAKVARLAAEALGKDRAPTAVCAAQNDRSTSPVFCGVKWHSHHS